MSEKNLLPHQQRVVDEKNELFDKIQKLENFIEVSPIYKNLSLIEMEDLNDQMRFMKNYLNILKRRINRF